MLVTVVGVDVFSGDTVIEMTQKVNVYRSFRSGKQCFGSRVAVNPVRHAAEPTIRPWDAERCSY